MSMEGDLSIRESKKGEVRDRTLRTGVSVKLYFTWPHRHDPELAAIFEELLQE